MSSAPYSDEENIILCSGSDDNESYASGDLEEILEELAIDEEEELTTDNSCLDNLRNTNDIQWNEYANKQQTFPFTGKGGLLMDLPSDITPSEVLSLFLNEKVINLMVTETNRYAEQKLLQHGTIDQARLKRWKSTTSEEIKTFIAMMIWMGLVQTPLTKC